MRIAAVAIHSCRNTSPEDVYVPRAKKHPHLVAFLLKLNAAAPMWLGPVETARQNSRIHPIQEDGLKQSTDWWHTGHVEYTEQKITTNHDLVAWPRDIHVHTDSR